MDNKTNDIENVLLDIFVNDRIDPSKDWLNLSLKELIERLESFKRKQADFSEKDHQRKAIIADGLFINALLTLVHNKYALEKSECLEFAVYPATTGAEQVLETAGQSSSSLDNCTKSGHSLNLDALSREQEQYLIHLADFLPSALDLKKNMKDGLSKQKEHPCMSHKHIGKWQRLHVKWHAAGHILFWLDKEANTEKIKNKLLHTPKLFDLLDLGILPSTGKCPNTPEGEEIKFRTLENEIRKVNPRGAKKGRPRKNDIQSEYFVFSPLICKREICPSGQKLGSRLVAVF
jgi:hypothetical protein